MEKRILGRTNLEVSLLGMGGLFISSVGGKGRDEACKAIRRALELGVNYLDSAPTYADSEEVLGIALEGIPRNSYYLSTKLGGRPQPFNPKDKDALRRSVDESLRLLKTDYIDILMIHEPDRPGQYDWWTDYDNFYGPVLELLEELKGQKIIRFTGLGGTTAYQLPHIMATGNYDVVLTAFNYSLLWREAEIAIFPEAKKQNMGVIIGSPLQQGALSRKYPEIETGAWWLSPPRQNQYKRLYAYLDEINLSLPEAGIRMVLSNPIVSTILMGARSVEEVEQNVKSVNAGPLSEEILSELQKIADMVPFRPFEEPFGLPFGRKYFGPGIAR
ncbi:TPA: aldo/keto reductase [Candidatus Poribacteria bacterium]|nr:aldo/keto reductase [Candidatus Poribacteria bacterium]